MQKRLIKELLNSFIFVVVLMVGLHLGSGLLIELSEYAQLNFTEKQIKRGCAIGVMAFVLLRNYKKVKDYL